MCQIDSGLGNKYAVMFYIHGGEFTHGASNLFPAHILAAFYDVVVVSINYRLGALGKSMIKIIMCMCVGEIRQFCSINT